MKIGTERKYLYRAIDSRVQTIEFVLPEMGTAAGGFLLPAYAPKVRAAAEALVLASNGGRLEGERS